MRRSCRRLDECERDDDRYDGHRRRERDQWLDGGRRYDDRCDRDERRECARLDGRRERYVRHDERHERYVRHDGWRERHDPQRGAFSSCREMP